MSDKKPRFSPKNALCSAKNALSDEKKLTVTAIAIELGVSRKTLESWRHQGCPGIPPDDANLGAILRWSDRNGKRAGKVGEKSVHRKEEKLAEEIRKLKIANDAKEGALISRAWVAERIQRAAGELNAARTKSEAEHPMRFAAAAGDVAATRTIVRGIWDDIFNALHSLGSHFES